MQCVSEPLAQSIQYVGSYYVSDSTSSWVRYLPCQSGYIWSDLAQSQAVYCLGGSLWTSIPSTLTCVRMLLIIKSPTIMDCISNYAQVGSSKASLFNQI